MARMARMKLPWLVSHLNSRFCHECHECQRRGRNLCWHSWVDANSPALRNHLSAANQAVFCVTPSARAISQLLMPFLQLTTSHIATSHLSKPIGESSMIVPTFAENWRFA